MTNKHSQQYYRTKLENTDKAKHEKYLAKKRDERFQLAKTFLRTRIDSFIQESGLDKQIIKRVENINSGYIIKEKYNVIEELINSINSGNASQRIFESLSSIFSEFMCSRLIHRSLEIKDKNIIKDEYEFRNKSKNFIIFNDIDFGWKMNVYRFFEESRITPYKDYMQKNVELLKDSECIKKLRCSVDGFGGIGFSDNSFIIECDDEQIPHDDKSVIKFLNNKLTIIIRPKFKDYFDSSFEFKMPFDVKVNGELFFLKENE